MIDMGQSLGATLVYGYAVAEEEGLWEDEDDDDDDDDDGDWETRILHRRGVYDQTDWSDYPEPNYDLRNYEERDADHKERLASWKEEQAEPYDAWHAAIKAVKAEFPNITIEYGGVSEYMTPVIGIKDSGFDTFDSISKISIETFAKIVTGHDHFLWNDELQRFAQEAGIDLARTTWDDEPVFQGPAYWLALNYG